jgi:hypothetical protein
MRRQRRSSPLPLGVPVVFLAGTGPRPSHLTIRGRRRRIPRTLAAERRLVVGLPLAIVHDQYANRPACPTEGSKPKPPPIQQAVSGREACGRLRRRREQVLHEHPSKPCARGGHHQSLTSLGQPLCHGLSRRGRREELPRASIGPWRVAKTARHAVDERLEDMLSLPTGTHQEDGSRLTAKARLRSGYMMGRASGTLAGQTFELEAPIRHNRISGVSELSKGRAGAPPAAPSTAGRAGAVWRWRVRGRVRGRTGRAAAPTA